MKTKKRLELIGWISFTLGSIIFLLDNIRLANTIGIIGSLIFLIGCIVFMASEKY